MLETSVQVIITLSDPQLKDEALQEAVQNLQLDLRDVEGVTEAGLIPVEEAPPNSKGIGGFLLGQLQASVTVKGLRTLVNVIGKNTFGRTIKIKAEGNGKKLEIELNRPEDLEKIMPQVEKFINE